MPSHFPFHSNCAPSLLLFVRGLKRLRKVDDFCPIMCPSTTTLSLSHRPIYCRMCVCGKENLLRVIDVTFNL
uniref:Secreted protein n=1 Tax=Caenorhabditis tropicalis TaxID=1561998 RepID=A0A1I7UIX2_9PELO